eukprot:jgi/Bigna1/138922/aug1.47_g13630
MASKSSHRFFTRYSMESSDRDDDDLDGNNGFDVTMATNQNAGEGSGGGGQYAKGNLDQTAPPQGEDGEVQGEYSSEHEDLVDYKPGGYHPVQIGDIYNNRYMVHRKLGAGHFSTVWLCTDVMLPFDSPRKVVALKIQKSDSKYTEAAEDEDFVVDLLDSFAVLGPNGRHVCLVFEVMAKSLLNLIKKTNFKGVPIETARHIAKQMLLGVDFLHSRCSIIHTDLKPENFLLGCQPKLTTQVARSLFMPEHSFP